ncbi:hypothetical protein ABPG77_006764 [Micractinium sp. CCAP 211/92]
MGVDVAPSEEHPGFFAVQLRLDADNPQELAPLEEPVANHIADVLRLKLAMDAGEPPLSQLALSRGLEDFEDMLEDLRAETMEAVMETMAAAAAGDGDGEGSEGGFEVDQRASAGLGHVHARQAVGEAAGSPAAGSAGGAATDGGSVAAPQQGQPQPAPAGAAAGRQEASDQTDVPLQLSAEHAAVEQPGKQPQRAQQAQQGAAPAAARARQFERQGQQPAPAQRPGRRRRASVDADARLARKLQRMLIAEERRASRQRRSAAPAEGTLKARAEKEGGLGAGSPSEPAWEGEGEERPEFHGVSATQGGGELRWQATISAVLDHEERPSLEGRRHCGREVCECGSQGEAAVSRDLALLWREARLGFLKGDLTWQEEEYNFEGEGYHKQLDVTAPLLKCRTLPELKALLASLAAEGRLAQLAGSLQRNPLSFIVRRPPVEPCTQEALAAAQQRYRHVRGNAGETRLPWRAIVPLPAQLRSNHVTGAPVLTCGTYGTPAQAAAAADLAVAWREEVLQEQGDVEGQQYNFPLQEYREHALVWGKLMAADGENELRVLLRKLRDCGKLDAIARQQGEAAQCTCADAVPGAGGRKRGHSGPLSAATTGSGWSGGVDGKGSGSPSKKRGRPEAAAAPAVGAAAVAGAAAPAAGAHDGGDGGPDPLPLFTELTAAADTAAAQQAGISLELCGRYLIALQSKPCAMQHWEVGCLRMWVAQHKWDGVAGTMRAAVRAAGLE